jgi:hypothetical protein
VVGSLVFSDMITVDSIRPIMHTAIRKYNEFKATSSDDQRPAIDPIAVDQMIERKLSKSKTVKLATTYAVVKV